VTGDAIQLGRFNFDAVTGAGDFQRGDTDFLTWDSPLLMFLILIVPSCFVSYGTTVFLVLPLLYLLSAWRSMTAFKVCMLAGCGGYRPADIDGFEEQWAGFRPADRELRGVLPALGY